MFLDSYAARWGKSSSATATVYPDGWIDLDMETLTNSPGDLSPVAGRGDSVLPSGVSGKDPETRAILRRLHQWRSYRIPEAIKQGVVEGCGEVLEAARTKADHELILDAAKTIGSLVKAEQDDEHHADKMDLEQYKIDRGLSDGSTVNITVTHAPLPPLPDAPKP